jgi:hypothetical protein
MRGIATLFLTISSTAITYAQGGYFINGPTKILPEATFDVAPIPLFVPVNREDVKAIGMGKTQVANGRTFNGMMYNPALLATPKTSIEALTVQASLPPETFDAALFLKDHISEFKDALSLKQLRTASQDLVNATTAQQVLADLQAIQDGLRFPRDLLTKVIGSSDNPQVHGFRVLPAISAQIGNFGFSLYGTIQTGFQVTQSATLDALLKVKIPANVDVNDPAQLRAAAQAAQDLLTILNAVILPDGTFSIEDAYPVTFSVSYIDIVGAAGYGYRLTKNIDLGANIKVINRRFSTKIVQTNNVDDILGQVRSDFNSSATGFTFDLGGCYHFNFGLDVGLSLQNIIPVQKISSTVTQKGWFTGYDYQLDNLGNKQVNGNGDTAVIPVALHYTGHIPVELRLPFIMNLGTRYPITPEWDVAFDWADIAAQDERFENYGQRLRLGTEYRLDAIKDVLGIAPRLGYADSRITVGLGINLFKLVQLDGAYAYDEFIQERSYFAQVRIGW